MSPILEDFINIQGYDTLMSSVIPEYWFFETQVRSGGRGGAKEGGPLQI